MVMFFYLIALICAPLEGMDSFVLANSALDVLPPLHRAINEGDLVKMMRLIDNKCDLNKEWEGWHPLAYAYYWNQDDAFELLVEAGSDPSLYDGKPNLFYRIISAFDAFESLQARKLKLAKLILAKKPALIVSGNQDDREAIQMIHYEYPEQFEELKNSLLCGLKNLSEQESEQVKEFVDQDTLRVKRLAANFTVKHKTTRFADTQKKSIKL